MWPEISVRISRWNPWRFPMLIAFDVSFRIRHQPYDLKTGCQKPATFLWTSASMMIFDINIPWILWPFSCWKRSPCSPLEVAKAHLQRRVHPPERSGYRWPVVRRSHPLTRGSVVPPEIVEKLGRCPKKSRIQGFNGKFIQDTSENWWNCSWPKVWHLACLFSMERWHCHVRLCCWRRPELLLLLAVGGHKQNQNNNQATKERTTKHNTTHKQTSKQTSTQTMMVTLQN